MPKNAKKTDERHLQFFNEWLIDFNATRAYMAVYKRPYSESVRVMASKLLSNLLTKANFKLILEEHNKKLEDDGWLRKEYVLNGLKELVERCMQKKPVMDFDYENKCLVQKVDEDDNNVWDFDSRGASKGFELLGKHLQLFTDKISHSGDVNLISINPPKGLKKRGVIEDDTTD